jgi:hypothetical protein
MNMNTHGGMFVVMKVVVVMDLDSVDLVPVDLVPIDLVPVDLVPADCSEVAVPGVHILVRR